MPDCSESPLVLSLEPKALARCFLVADIMEDIYGEPLVEYGLIGLADRACPLHVVETPLLPGQSVTVSSVDQPGADVLRMHREIQALARKRNSPLIPITFIHRHPGACRPSTTDLEFLSGVFIDQISTAHTFQEVLPGEREDLLCRKCVTSMPGRSRRSFQFNGSTVELEFAVCFSLIVNKEREYSITAVRKEFCPACGSGQIRYVPAEMAVRPQQSLTTYDLDELRKALELEIAAKVQFC